ncbi:MAG: hypothetical protein IJI19_00775 [Ruminococcus sp.]|nr:hypothetical protein [Ruminococcus sp.]
MKFPNAKKGIKNIFTGQLLMLISVILTTISSIAILVVDHLQNDTSETVTGVSAIGLLLFSLAGAVLTVTALVFNIIGVIRASKDEPVFKGVIFLMIFTLAVVIISAVFANVQVIARLADLVNDISGTITTVLIVIGFNKIAEKLGDEVVFRKGQNLLRVIIWIVLLSVIMKAVALFAPVAVVMVLEVVMLIVTGLLEVLQTFLYLFYLSKTKKMLQEC